MTDESITPISLAVDGERQLSTNFFWRKDFNGQVFDLQTTVRDNPSDEQIKAHIVSVETTLSAIVGLGGIAKNLGTPPAASVTSIAATTLGTPEAPQAQADKPKLSTLPPPTGAVPVRVVTSGESFEAKTLMVSTYNGKPSYKVAGGQFSKYGVTIWPEILNQVTNCEALAITTPDNPAYDLSGYKAIYETKDGKPHKVVYLEKV